MSASALALVVLIAAGDADDRVGGPMARAAEEALGPPAQVVLREVPVLPSDDEALQMGARLRASAVVELAWADREHTRAVVRVRTLASGERWLRREIAFALSDLATERARTLGFAAASMMPAPSDDSAPKSAGAPPPSPIPDPFLPGAPARAPAAAISPPRARRASTGLFEALAVATVGAAGEGPGLGGGLSGELTLPHGFGLRLALEARTAQVPGVAANSYTLLAAPGVAWRPLGSSGGRSFSLGGRVEAILGAYSLSHAGASWPFQWSPGARLLVDTAWLLSEGAGIALAAGVEAPFREVEVLAGGTTKTYYPLRVVLEVGVRAGF